MMGGGGLLFFRAKRRPLVQRQDVRPEYSTGPDDDLYGSPRSWTGAQWSETHGEADPNVRLTENGFETTVLTRESESSGFEMPSYSRESVRDPRPPLPRHRKTSLLQERNVLNSVSPLTVQTIAAVFLVGTTFFMFHSTRPLALQMQKDVRTVFSSDYLSTLLPKQLAYDLGMNVQSSANKSVPVSIGTVQAVLPMKGTVVRSYSVVSPDLVIEGRPGSEVVAATDGLVTDVGETQAYGKYITIDHGAFGQTFYAHLGAVNVHTHEYVVAGQSIGYLPKNQRELVFGYIRGNSYRNPSVLFGGAK